MYHVAEWSWAWCLFCQKHKCLNHKETWAVVWVYFARTIGSLFCHFQKGFPSQNNFCDTSTTKIMELTFNLDVDRTEQVWCLLDHWVFCQVLVDVFSQKMQHWDCISCVTIYDQAFLLMFFESFYDVASISTHRNTFEATLLNIIVC